MLTIIWAFSDSQSFAGGGSEILQELPKVTERPRVSKCYWKNRTKGLVMQGSHKPSICNQKKKKNAMSAKHNTMRHAYTF